MIPAFQALKNALVYASFEDADVEIAMNKLVETLNDELYTAGFEPSSAIESATDALNEALDAADEEDEEEEGVDEEEEGEFAGLETDEEPK